MSELLTSKVSPASYSADALRLEGVTVSVGFSDLLEEVLKRNHAHFDQLIVVTSHADTATQQVARKYGTTVVVTDYSIRMAGVSTRGPRSMPASIIFSITVGEFISTAILFCRIIFGE